MEQEERDCLQIIKERDDMEECVNQICGPMTKKTNEAAKETHPQVPPNCPYFVHMPYNHIFKTERWVFETPRADMDTKKRRIRVELVKTETAWKSLIACVAAEYWRIEEKRLSRLQKLGKFYEEIERKRRIAWTTTDEWRVWGGLIK